MLLVPNHAHALLLLTTMTVPTTTMLLAVVVLAAALVPSALSLGDYSHCEPLTLKTCQRLAPGLRYNITHFPNLIGHKSQDEAGKELAKYHPLIKIGCSKVRREKIKVTRLTTHKILLKTPKNKKKNTSIDIIGRERTPEIMARSMTVLFTF